MSGHGRGGDSRAPWGVGGAQGTRKPRKRGGKKAKSKLIRAPGGEVERADWGGRGGPSRRERPGDTSGAKPPAFEVERETTCPFLLRVFPRLGGNHRSEEYRGMDVVPRDEVAVYTWLDATLRELADLVAEVHPGARRQGARLAFALVYPDRGGRHVVRPVGTVRSARAGAEDGATLQATGFQIGDYLDVGIQ